jgi:hypothetical protein
MSEITPLPPFSNFVQELHPQPEDLSTLTGFVSASDIEKIMERVYLSLQNHSVVISSQEDIAKGDTGAQGVPAPTFRMRGIISAADPRDLHDPDLVPRPSPAYLGGYTGSPWMYLLRYTAPTPDPLPADGAYTVGSYYNNAIGMWVWSPRSGIDPQDPAADVLEYGPGSNPLLPTSAAAPWPDKALPVFTRVGPWEYIGDVSDTSATALNASLMSVMGTNPVEIRGSRWFYGEGPPTGEDFLDGDAYVDTTTYNLYYFTA